MAEQQNFRTAFNGFNREDVVHYIEFLNAKHAAQINQLTSELEFLRSQLSQNQEHTASDTTAATPAEGNSDLIEQQASRIRELFDENKALKEWLNTAQWEKSEAETQLEAALAGKSQAETQLNNALAENAQIAANLQSALQQQNSFKSRMEEELEAYRRAERTERMARERAEQLYRQANGALGDATAKVDNAAGQIGELTDRVLCQLNELQAAVSNSKQALRDAAATMYTIRPNTEEE